MRRSEHGLAWARAQPARHQIYGCAVVLAQVSWEADTQTGLDVQRFIK